MVTSKTDFFVCANMMARFDLGLTILLLINMQFQSAGLSAYSDTLMQRMGNKDVISILTYF
jgi:hypothetical protein